MRTAIAYLTSLLCHGAVLIPMAQVAAWHNTPPRYSMQGGGPAAVSLRASLAAPSEAADLDETQAVVTALPSSGQAGLESPPLPEPELTVLPEAKVLARVDLKAPAPVAAPHPAKPPTSRPTAVSHKPVQHPTAGLSSSAGKTAVQANRAAAGRHVTLRGPGSTGADAVTAAGSAGNSGGGQVDRAPSAAVSNPVPPYPADALARGIEGLVLLRVQIGADGSVEKATVHQSSGTPSLDASALSTVRRQWRFEPATRCGVAVSYEALLPIRFTIRAG